MNFANHSSHCNTTVKMFKLFFVATILFFVSEYLAYGCLITNCPRGGKRSGKFNIQQENSVKPCISCGPGHSGQCFGPSICCGPFGCLVGTQESLRCQRDGFFHEREPCIAGNGSCRRNTGRCASDGVCCTQESCHSDKECTADDKSRLQLQENIIPLDLYNFMNNEYGTDN